MMLISPAGRVAGGAGVLGGLGATMFTAAEIAEGLAKYGADSVWGDPELMAGWQARYGEGGTYEREPSVIRGEQESGGEQFALAPISWSTIPTYQYRSCNPTDTNCVMANVLAEQANLAIGFNAEQAWLLAKCEHEEAMNGRVPAGPRCDQYRVTRAVPGVPASVGAPMVASGSSAPLTPEQQQSLNVYQSQYTPEGVRRPTAPNQTTPPRPQPGEVVTSGTGAPPVPPPQTTGGDGKGVDGKGVDGKIFGMDPVMLAVIAGVGALLLRKK